MLLVQGYAKVVQESATKAEQVLHWHCAECNKNAVGVLKMIKVMQERQDRMEKEINELKKEINGVKNVRMMRVRNVWKS